MYSMHNCVYSNLIDPIEKITHFDTHYGFNRRLLSMSNSTVDAGNINKFITGKRSLPANWVRTFCTNKEQPEPIIQRIFWLLQYFCVYYCQQETDIIKTAPSLLNITTDSTSYIEYFQLAPHIRKHIILKLKNNCTLSPLIANVSIDNFDLHTFSRIIWDILEKHYLQSQTTKLSYTISQVPDVSTITTNKEQHEIFQSKIAIYGPKTIDYYHALLRYAHENIYAAHALSNIYFYGETFVFEGHSNFYQVIPNYKKSAEYCTLAINNSNPPYSPAYWSLGYLIYTGFHSDNEKDPTKLSVAKYYFEKAGAYRYFC